MFELAVVDAALGANDPFPDDAVGAALDPRAHTLRAAAATTAVADVDGDQQTNEHENAQEVAAAPQRAVVDVFPTSISAVVGQCTSAGSAEVDVVLLATTQTTSNYNPLIVTF